MQIKVEYIVDRLIPEGAITTVAGRAGIGKTYLLFGLMDAVTMGADFLGLKAKKTQAVYVDFENPLSVDIERARALNIINSRFWHTGIEPRPPRIDSAEYTQYLQLPPCLLIFDSLRASQSGDEDKSKDMALAMTRFKELRDYGHTIILIQHTLKSNERQFRGSMAIEDQADHVLFFYPVRSIKGGEVVDEGDADLNELPFYLGTREKTRFEHCGLYIKRAGNGRFTLAEDPKAGKIRAIAELCRGQEGMKQKDVVDLVNKELGLGREATRKLLTAKEGLQYWTITPGIRNSQLFSFTPYKGGCETEKQNPASNSVFQDDNRRSKPQHNDNAEFSSFSEGNRETEKQDIEEYLDHYKAQGLPLAECERLAKIDWEADRGTWEGSGQ